MMGPAILARTMGLATAKGEGGRGWQYHSRSDAHSKIACWTLLLDLMHECDVFRGAVAAGRIGFGINHVMVGPINKTLDLVVTLVPPGRGAAGRGTFSNLVAKYGVQLETDEAELLAELPTLLEDTARDVAEVAIAIEAKACMTEHSKSIPRLHAEILATGYLAKLAAPRCITASYNLVNAADSFVTPTGAGKVNLHAQPTDARRIVSMLRTALPMARQGSAFGYDVVGVTVIECRNDGSPVRIVTGDPAPAADDHVHYERMVRSLCSEFRSRFGH